MSAIQKLLRRNQTVDPIRESTAMTTVYLLEMNRKFELFVRAKIEELEGVVTGLEARAASQHEVWDDEAGRLTELEEAGQLRPESSLPSDVTGEQSAATGTTGAGETVAFDPATDDAIAPVSTPRPETALEVDNPDSARMVAFDPTAGAEPAAEPPALPEVAVGYQSLGSDPDDSVISLIDPTADAADEDPVAVSTAGAETTFAGDADEDAVSDDDDDMADLEPWERSMGFGVKGVFD